MNPLRALKRLFASQKQRRHAPRPRARLFVERLEVREVLTTYHWILGPGSSGNWNDGANWANLMTQTTGTVPGSSDYATFEDEVYYQGQTIPTTGDCVVNGDFTVDRVVMYSGYDGTLTVGDGDSLTAPTLFDQRGTLDLAGGSISTNGQFYVNGPINATAGTGSSSLTAGTGISLNSTGAVTVTGGSSTTPALVLTANNIVAECDITVGTTSTSGAISFVGNFTANATCDVVLYADSHLGFSGTTSQQFIVYGTFTMYGATVTTNRAMQIDSSGVFLAQSQLTPPDTINGDLTIKGTARGDIGSNTGGSHYAQLYLNGSLSVTSSATLNVYTNTLLDFDGAASGSTAVISGALNMYGALVDLRSGMTLQINSGGTLTTSASGTVTANSIDGSVSNSGDIVFAGSLHQLNVGGSYTQGSGGELSMRIRNDTGGVDNDSLNVVGSATLGGTLTVTALETLTGGQTWTIITSSGFGGTDFATTNLPTGVTGAVGVAAYNLTN